MAPKHRATSFSRRTKRLRRDDASTSEIGVYNGNPEVATSGDHSVLEEPLPPQRSAGLIPSEGEPPTADEEEDGLKWRHNLELPDAELTLLPSVLANWTIMRASLPEVERVIVPEVATSDDEPMPEEPTEEPPPPQPPIDEEDNLKWRYNLELLDAELTLLPSVPADWTIMEALP